MRLPPASWLLLDDLPVHAEFVFNLAVVGSPWLRLERMLDRSAFREIRERLAGFVFVGVGESQRNRASAARRAEGVGQEQNNLDTIDIKNFFESLPYCPSSRIKRR